jgi:hypothetical protein
MNLNKANSIIDRLETEIKKRSEADVWLSVADERIIIRTGTKKIEKVFNTVYEAGQYAEKYINEHENLRGVFACGNVADLLDDHEAVNQELSELWGEEQISLPIVINLYDLARPLDLALTAIFDALFPLNRAEIYITKKLTDQDVRLIKSLFICYRHWKANKGRESDLAADSYEFYIYVKMVLDKVINK